jgi:hypothetical protein
MELHRHPGFVEIDYPEFFSRDPRLDNFSRIVTVRQPGTHNLLLNLAGGRGEPAKRDDSEVRHFVRSMNDAFESLSDSVELIAILARRDQQAAAEPFVRELESLGYEARLFTDRNRASGWLTARY